MNKVVKMGSAVLAATVLVLSLYEVAIRAGDAWDDINQKDLKLHFGARNAGLDLWLSYHAELALRPDLDAPISLRALFDVDWGQNYHPSSRVGDDVGWVLRRPPVHYFQTCLPRQRLNRAIRLNRGIHLRYNC